MFCTSLIILVAHLELDSRQNGDDHRQHHAHGIAVTVLVLLEGGVVDVVHDGIGLVVGAAGSQQLDQCKALEGVDGGDHQNVQGGGHDGGPLDLPEALEIVCTVHFGSFHDGLIHVAQCRNIQHDGLAHRGGEQDQDDAAQSEPLVTQPVDVFVDEAQALAQVVEDAVVVVVHPLPHHSNGDRAGDHGQVEHAAEQAGGPLRQVYDGGRHPQREDAGDGHRHDDDDKGVFQCAQEDGVSKQGLVVGHAHKDVCTVHGGVKKAGDHAEDHGVDDKAQEEDQAGQQETIGGEGFTPDQGAAALGLLDRRFCSQENHRSFRS